MNPEMAARNPRRMTKKVTRRVSARTPTAVASDVPPPVLFDAIKRRGKKGQKTKDIFVKTQFFN
jgi:hypothetical protein